MAKRDYATPTAVLIAGTMISSAILLRPAQIENTVDGEIAVKQDTSAKLGIANNQTWPLRDYLLLTNKEDTSSTTADGIYTSDDLRLLLDAWEKQFFLSQPSFH